jgi:hypothetical protein
MHYFRAKYFQARFFYAAVFSGRTFANANATPDPGDSITGGTFSRGRWRKKREEDEARRLAALAAAREEARRARELKEAADARAKSAVRARWAQEDALAGASAHDRMFRDALASFASLQNIRPDPTLSIAAHRAQDEMDEEEEAIMLLLALES